MKTPSRLSGSTFFWTLILGANAGVPFFLERISTQFHFSIRVSGMATAIHEFLCSIILFFILRSLLDGKLWGSLYRWSIFSVAIGDLMYGISTYIIRLPPPRGFLPLVHELPYCFFALLSGAGLALRASESKNRKAKLIAIAGILAIAAIFFAISLKLIIIPFLHVTPIRPTIIYATAITYAVGQSIFVGALFVASMRTLFLAEFGMWFVWLLLVGSDLALRYLDMGNHLPMLTVFEYGWEFSLSAVLALTSLEYIKNENEKSLISRLAPLNSIRMVTGSLAFASLLALVMVTWLTFSYLGVVNANTVASYAIIFAVVWSVSNCGSIVVSQRVRELYVNLKGRENSVDNVPKGLSWEVREIYGLLQSKNIEVQAERDRVLNITSTVAHNVRSPLLALRTVLPILSNSLGKECGCERTIEPHVNTLNFAMRTIESTANDLLSERKRLTHNEPLASSIKGAVNIVGLKFPSKTFAMELADEIDGPRINGLNPTLINLLSNAAEASPDEKPIRVSVTKEQGRLKISIVDEGHGMPPQLLSDLIAGKSVTTKPSGNGLGVASAVSWAKTNGFEFNISSEIDRGTTVSLTV